MNTDTTDTPALPTLPSGKPYTVRKGYGRDLARAQELTKDSAKLSLALVAVLVRVDGQAVTLSDLEAMPLPDVTHLIGEAMPETQPDEAVDPAAPKTLPSGKAYATRAGFGRDLIAAQRMAKKPGQTTLALVAVLATVDGAPLVMEDVEAMDLADVLQLVGEVMPEGKAS